MKSSKVVYLGAIVLSIAYGFIYYILIGKAQINKVQIYYVQVGLYEKEASIEGMNKKLETIKLEGYKLKEDNLNAIVTCISNNSDAANECAKPLRDNNMEYIIKNKTIEEQEAKTAYINADYNKLMELMGN
ncbi:MAG: hypothetical protein RSG07_04490 [Erysipelotrichaceae bacterium]